MNDWIDHNHKEHQPEASKGLAAVDVVDGDGDMHEGVDPAREVFWGGIRRWRKSHNQPKVETPKTTQDTLNERGKTHGNFIEQARTSQELKNILKTHGSQPLTKDQHEALETICMKISRILHGNPNEPDHWRDIAGYATLVENILVHGRSHLG